MLSLRLVTGFGKAVRGSRCFYFYCDGATRVVHSFPTRRSSDLDQVPNPQRPCRAVAVLRLASIPPRHCRTYLCRDRKSTRLNSSHTVISYAVVCLKKKKQRNKDELAPSLRSLRRRLPGLKRGSP